MPEQIDNSKVSTIETVQGVATIETRETTIVSSTPEETEIINQLSLKLLQQTELSNKLQQRLVEMTKQLNQQKQLLVQARREKHDADLEVTRLSTEVENITQELFEQANSQVKEANKDAHDIKQLNDRLSNTIKEKDTTIEILQSELTNLKSIISNLDSVQTPNDDLKNHNKNFSNPNLISSIKDNDQKNIPLSANFSSKLLTPFNERPIYTPLFNQLRFDLPAFRLFCDALLSKTSETLSTSSSGFDIRTSKFFLKLLEELDEQLRLDKAPALQTLKLRWNRKSFLTDLMDKSVNIEPLSAATEAWKSQTLQKYIPNDSLNEISTSLQQTDSDKECMPSLSRFSTNTTASSYDPTLFKFASNNTTNSHPENVAPLAVTSSCGLCGEKRKDMNFSRLYHLRIYAHSEEKLNKVDYPLCINCANRYRTIVELLKYLASINPNTLNSETDLDDYIRSSWAKFVELKSKMWYAVNIGVWSEKEIYGLVYGWQNDWLVGKTTETKSSDNLNNKEMEPVSTSIEKTPEPESTPTSQSSSVTESENIQESSSDATEGKGWNGWSSVIAKSNTDSSVDVGAVGVGVKRLSSQSLNQRTSIHDSLISTADKETLKESSGESKENTDDDETNFQDASEGMIQAKNAEDEEVTQKEVANSEEIKKSDSMNSDDID
jgi:hypothetical protein